MAFQPKFDAVIFDLDGVITKTALVHAASWKRMFDEYMKGREERFSEPFREFTHAGDYLPYVDGKPRYKGVASFLESRGIDIPFGDPSDDPDMETVCGLGNKKNIMFNKVLDDDGVEVYESSVKMLEGLKAAGVRIGVASSSKNCKPVLECAGLLHYFETRVDGVVSAEIGLQGKPEPDIFTTACDNRAWSITGPLWWKMLFRVFRPDIKGILVLPWGWPGRIILQSCRLVVPILL